MKNSSVNVYRNSDSGAEIQSGMKDCESSHNRIKCKFEVVRFVTAQRRSRASRRRRHIS